VKFLLVFQDFKSYVFFLWVGMVHAAENHSEGTTSQLFHNLITIVYLVCYVIQVIPVFGVETIIELLY